MSLRLVALCFAALDPARLEAFWTDALAPGPPTFALKFEPTAEPKQGKNRIHIDLSSTSLADQAATVERLLGLGATHVDIGQGPDADHVVLADPEGNEFCVVQPDNFTGDGGFFGSITCDGSGPEVGYFWSAALDWPLVWDQDDETAIRAPDGRGQYITFGPPLGAKQGKNRLHLDIAPPADGDLEAEVARLVSLGARRIDIGQGDVPWVVLADPDDNEFCVLTPR